MSIFDLIEQQVALHREMFGDKPTHVALCQRHMREAAMLVSTPTKAFVPTTVAGLSIKVSPLEHHLPYVY